MPVEGLQGLPELAVQEGLVGGQPDSLESLLHLGECRVQRLP